MTQRYLIFLLFLLLIIACSENVSEHKHLPHLEKDAEFLAMLQCEAREIQKERFALAIHKNALEDSILKHQKMPSKAQKFNKEWQQIPEKAEDVYQRTKIMADSIQAVLKSFWKGDYKALKDRELLDEALERSFSKLCPEIN